MADIISLKQHRKRQARAEEERRAAENRTRHGVSKKDKKLSEALNARAKKDLDARKRED